MNNYKNTPEYLNFLKHKEEQLYEEFLAYKERIETLKYSKYINERGNNLSYVIDGSEMIAERLFRRWELHLTKVNPYKGKMIITTPNKSHTIKVGWNPDGIFFKYNGQYVDEVETLTNILDKDIEDVKLRRELISNLPKILRKAKEVK